MTHFNYSMWKQYYSAEEQRKGFIRLKTWSELYFRYGYHLRTYIYCVSVLASICVQWNCGCIFLTILPLFMALTHWMILAVTRKWRLWETWFQTPANLRETACNRRSESVKSRPVCNDVFTWVLYCIFTPIPCLVLFLYVCNTWSFFNRASNLRNILPTWMSC